MRRKRHGMLTEVLLAAVLGVTVLGGCGQKNKEPEGTERTDTAVTLIESETETDEAAGADEQEDESKEDAADPAAYNNGGNFVRVGEKTYFWKIPAEALPKSELFGNYHDFLEPEGGASTLLCYDNETGETTEILSEVTTGVTYYAGGRLYLEKPFLNISTDTYEIQNYSVKLDGSDRRKGGYGEIDDMRPDEGVYITRRYDDALDAIYEARSLADGTVQNEFKADAQAYGNQYVTGTEKGFLVWHGDAAGVYTMTFVPYEAGKEPQDLGEYEGDPYVDFYSPVQVEQQNGRYYISLEGRSGSAQSYCDCDILELDLSQMTMNKVKVNKPSVEDALMDEVNYFTFENGEPVFSEQPNREVFQFQSGPSEFLMYRDGGEWNSLPSVRRKNTDEAPTYSFTRERIERLEYTGDAVYAIVNDEIRDPGRDIGWRYSYRPMRIRYMRIDTRTGDVTTMATTQLEDRSFMAYVWKLDSAEDTADAPIRIAFCPMYMVTANERDLMNHYELTDDDLMDDYSLEFAETGHDLYTADVDPDMAWSSYEFVENAEGYSMIQEVKGDMNDFFDRLYAYEEEWPGYHNCHLDVSDLQDAYSAASLPVEKFDPDSNVAPLLLELTWNEDASRIEAIKEIYRP